MSHGLQTPRPRLWARSVVSAGLLTVVIALAGLVLGAAPASAHATLLGTDPSEGQVLPTAPDKATLTFDENVRLQPGGVHVFAADGTELAAEATTSDTKLVIALPDALSEGTYIVAWRVISTDGHPVAGALTFSVGQPSERVSTPKITENSTKTGVQVGLAALQALVYIGLFLAAGLRFFLIVLLPHERGLDEVRTRTRRVLSAGAWVAIGAVILQLPVNLAYQRGSGLFSALKPALLEVNAAAPDQWAALLLVAGLLACMFAPPRFALAGSGVALASLALVGHPRSFGPPVLTGLSDITHVFAGSVWLGGLVGLVIASPRLSSRPRLAAITLTRFSTVAAFLLATVAATGSILVWRILGSWSGFIETSFGITFLIKLGFVGLAALLAAWNRFRLLPAVTAEAAHQPRERAGQRLRHVIRLEAGLLVVILGVTGVLVDRSPSGSTGPAGVAAPAGLDDQTFVGQAPGLRVVLRVDPLTIGTNDILVQLQDDAENPIEPFSAPAISFSLDSLDLGDQKSTNIDSGTYQVRVVLPKPGTWTADVTVRTGEFDSRVVPVRFRLR